MSTLKSHIDDVNNSILIIKSANTNLEKTERYLHQRGWNVRVISGSLNQGVHAAALFDPAYIFVSTAVLPSENNPLYVALKKSFHVVVFSEKTDSKALHLSQMIESPAVLLTDLSGPMVERTIQKISVELPPPVSKAFATRDTQRMAVATDLALAKICQATNGPTRMLGHCRKVHCFTIQTPDLSGYIVISGSAPVGSHFPRRFREALEEFMNGADGTFKSGDIHEIELREVQFEGLALSTAEFFKKAAHMGQEVAIAFFRLNTEVKIEKSIRPDWLKTDIAMLSPDQKIDFDLYIYLPVNQKFILYKKAGDMLEDKQLHNLTGKGVTEMHLHPNHLPHLHRYRMKTHLDSLIAEFQSDNTQVTSSGL